MKTTRLGLVHQADHGELDWIASAAASLDNFVLCIAELADNKINSGGTWRLLRELRSADSIKLDAG